MCRAKIFRTQQRTGLKKTCNEAPAEANKGALNFKEGLNENVILGMEDHIERVRESGHWPRSLFGREVLLCCAKGHEDGRGKEAQEAVGQAGICVLLLDDNCPPLKGRCQTRG